MTRYPDWPARLHAFIEARRRMPFAWGSNDCAAFAAGVVEAMTGECPFVDAYTHTTALQAERVLRRLGCADVFAWASLGLGPSMGNVLMAQRGDVVGFDLGNGPTLGICVGAAFAGPGAAGLIFLPLTGADRRWRI